MARHRRTIPAPAVMIGVGIGFDYGGREPVAPERFLKSQSESNIDWSGLVGAGENTNGITVQGPNGTDHGPSSRGTNQRDWGNTANGRRWSGGLDWSKNGGNRSGE